MNKLTDLNDALFEALDRLNAEELDDDPEKCRMEINRSKAIASIGQAIVANARIALDGQKMMAEFSRAREPVLPDLLAEDTK